MKMPTPPALARLPLSEVSLFLDLDGTLAPLCPSPADVAPDARRTSLLRLACERLAGRVAIVSGRTVDAVDAIIEKACLAVSGVHGLQRRSAAGDLEVAVPHPRLRHAEELMTEFARGRPGLLVELKDQSAALHYRGAPNAEAAVMEFVGRLAETEALAIQVGHMVAELRTPGPDKGAAVRAFLAELPFKGTTPIYLGDDVTDEAAFTEVAAHGGAGILVGSPRPSAAVAGVAGPVEVHLWLAESLRQGAFDLGGLRRWVG